MLQLVSLAFQGNMLTLQTAYARFAMQTVLHVKLPAKPALLAKPVSSFLLIRNVLLSAIQNNMQMLKKCARPVITLV